MAKRKKTQKLVNEMEILGTTFKIREVADKDGLKGFCLTHDSYYDFVVQEHFNGNVYKFFCHLRDLFGTEEFSFSEIKYQRDGCPTCGPTWEYETDIYVYGATRNQPYWED